MLKYCIIQLRKFLVLNKIDRMTNEEIIKAINSYKELFNFAEIVPISALQKNNIDELIKCIKKYLQNINNKN